MDLRLPKRAAQIQAKAKAFAERHLFPYELECEMSGTLSPASFAKIKKAVLASGFNGFNHAKKDGGPGFTHLEQLLLHEELGKATCGLWTLVWAASLPLRHGTAEQRREFLLPINRGERRSCYAITEPDAGSDPRMVKRKLPVPAASVTTMPTLKMIATVCNHQGIGAKMKWCAPIIE